MTLKRALAFFACGVVAVAALPTFVQAADSIKDVVVTNTTDNPVPTAAVGTTQVGGTVEVGNLPAVQSVDGTVDVGNLPAVQEVRGTVDVADREVRRGHATISLESAFPRSIDLPEDVILTDAVLTRANLSSSDDICTIWLFEVKNGAFGPIHQLRPSAAEPIDELHFESGIGYNEDTERMGFFMNSDCRINVLWTGYTAS